MKKIIPVFWKRGLTDANQINLIVTYDNLLNICNYTCQVYTNDVVIDNLLCSITDGDYNNWDGTADYLYSYTATKLDITLI